ncbi:MAG: tyrosine-type recombinase/integrase [Sphingomonas sp.]|uniref:tyrosine-type recombinase/integrase n=1 Tax=Sphingomonas sp. TaxID=28214 RepID=UPI001B20C85A|nr:tyrosine-type recombinase/integrase [Sphingomonas sp.]MBO9624115.1 tyrosine-type recombinase/integrase [Sphingomonas sp.]
MMMSDLPPHVYPVKDRHGKTRYRFVRKGWKGGYLPGDPGAAEFHARYAALVGAGPVEPASAGSPRSIKPRSLDELVIRYKKTVRWSKKGARTQLVQGRILERFCDRVGKTGRRYGERPVASVTVAWLETVFGTMAETPAAANELRKVLAGLMDCARRMSPPWITDNPVRLTDKYDKGEGFHDWTNEEIEQYRAYHKLGSMARLTLELALNTAARRCNVNKIERDHIKGGRVIVDHAKGNNQASVPLLATTRAAIDALPAAPIRFLVTTQFGKPFTDAGLGNRMRKWCDDAGLPHCSMHGLRKATARRLAEGGATDAEGQAVTGHKKAETFAYYRARANRAALADRAFSNLEPEAGFQPQEKD